MLKIAETEDAYTLYEFNSDKYLIFYNDISKEIIQSNRYRWNIAHELGHVVLNHHKSNNKAKLFRNTLSEKEYKDLEDEADQFASYILVPHTVMYYAMPSTHYDLKEYCQISDAAAKIRYKEYALWRRRNKIEDYDHAIGELFYQYLFANKCSKCGHVFFMKRANYCLICGNKNLNWGTKRNMIYSSFDTYSNRKLKRCPICGNEDTDIDGMFCQICGASLINYCDDRDYHNQGFINIDEDDNSPCGVEVAPNARYCPHCGSKTTFYNDNLLADWRTEKAEYEDEMPFN
jgi:Zn-dependent peptidase ImmA (M78 family)